MATLTWAWLEAKPSAVSFAWTTPSRSARSCWRRTELSLWEKGTEPHGRKFRARQNGVHRKRRPPRRAPSASTTSTTACMLWVTVILALLFGSTKLANARKVIQLRHPLPETVWYEGRHGLVEWSFAGWGAPLGANLTWTIDLVRATTDRSTPAIKVGEHLESTGTLRFRVPVGVAGAFEQRFRLRFSSQRGAFEVPDSSFTIRPKTLLLLEPAAPDPWMVQEGLERRYSFDDPLRLSWRAEPSDHDCIVDVFLQSPYPGIKKVVLVSKASCTTSQHAVKIPPGTPPGPGYRVLLVARDGRTVESAHFTLAGQHLHFSEPVSSDGPFTNEDTVHVRWIAHASLKKVHRVVDLVLISKGMKREISLLSVDADRERASVALASVAPNLQSGYYRLQARGLKSRAILGISGEFYVAGFETFLLSPVLADIQEPTGALEALPTYSDVLPIRWHFNNPGKRVGSVDVVLRAVQNPSLVFPIAHDLSLSRRRHQMVSLDWTLPVADLRKARLLETAVRLDVFPHVPVTSNAGGGFAVSGALTASRAVSGPFVLADASDNTSPFAERAREFRHDALLFSSHEGVGQHWTLGTTTKVPQAVRMDPRTRGAARELRLVVPNAEHIVKATRSLDAGIGEVFLVPPDLASGTMVFIKAVDAQRPDRVLGATGPFWLDGLYAQIFMPGSGDLGVRPGEKIFFAWRLPSSERANAEVALWVRGNEQRMNAKIPRAQRNGDTWRSTWTVPCQMPRGKYTVVQRLSSATTNSPKAAGRDAYSPPLLHFNVVSLEAGVTAPLHRDTWRPGMRARIAWVVDINENACLWPAAKPVDIVVQLLAGGQEMVLAQEVPNSGEIFVNLPRDLAEDHAAHVLIKPHDTSAAGYMTLKSEPFRIARVPLGTYLPLDELGGQAGAERSPHVISGASHSHVEPRMTLSQAALAQRLAVGLGLLLFCMGVVAIGVYFRHEVSYMVRGGGSVSLEPESWRRRHPRDDDVRTAQDRHPTERERRDECRQNAFRALSAPKTQTGRTPVARRRVHTHVSKEFK